MDKCYFTSGGLRLAADVLGYGPRPPVLLLHGGGQTRHAWDSTAKSLVSKGWTTVAVDLRGHGDSEWSADGDYSLDAFADDVRGVVAELAPPPVLVGASLGGLSSLLALSEAPAADAMGLVLVDVAHRFESVGAQRIVDFMRDDPAGFAHPQEAAAAVARYLPHRQGPGDTTGIETNLRMRDGRWHWHWDPRLLGASRPLLDPETGPALSHRVIAAVRRLKIPTMLIRGAISDVISRPIAHEFAELAPLARIVEVDGAAHMVAGDENDRFTGAVVAFLEDLTLPPPSRMGTP